MQRKKNESFNSFNPIDKSPRVFNVFPLWWLNFMFMSLMHSSSIQCLAIIVVLQQNEVECERDETQNHKSLHEFVLNARNHVGRQNCWTALIFLLKVLRLSFSTGLERSWGVIWPHILHVSLKQATAAGCWECNASLEVKASANLIGDDGEQLTSSGCKWKRQGKNN